MAFRPYLWLALVFAIILGALWQFIPLEDAKKRMDSLPLKGIGYQGADVSLTPNEILFFKDVNVLKRKYSIEDREYFITVVDGTRNRHLVHDPYYCFSGSGWTIVGTKKIQTNKGYADLLTLSKQGEIHEALFWFSDGTKQHSSTLYYWWQSILRRLTLGKSGPEPVLIIVRELDTETKTMNWNKLIRAMPSLFDL